MTFKIIGYGPDEDPDKPDHPDNPDNPAHNQKPWEAEGVQLQFSVLSLLLLFAVCLTYPDTHDAGWIEPDNPGFCHSELSSLSTHLRTES